MNVGTLAEKVLDGFYLPFRIPCRAGDETVRCVMKRTASASVLGGVGVGASRQQQANDFDAIAGRSQMQGGVADVNPMEYP